MSNRYRLLSKALSRNPTAVILVSSLLKNKASVPEGTRIMMLDRYVKGFPKHSVFATFDYARAGKEIAEKCVRDGNRNIAVLCEDVSFTDDKRFIEAVSEVFESEGCYFEVFAATDPMKFNRAFDVLYAADSFDAVIARSDEDVDSLHMAKETLRLLSVKNATSKAIRRLLPLFKKQSGIDVKVIEVPYDKLRRMVSKMQAGQETVFDLVRIDMAWMEKDGERIYQELDMALWRLRSLSAGCCLFSVKSKRAAVSVICVRFVQKSKNKLNVLFEYGVLILWLLPSTSIALGLTVAYGDKNPLIFNKVLVGTTVILLIGYTVIKLPFSCRMIKAAFFSLDGDLEEAAKCMGAGAFTTMRKVILPVIFPMVMSVVIKAASDESASVDARAMSFVYTVVLMILSSVALYFGQGSGMDKIKKMKQRRLERRVARN